MMLPSDRVQLDGRGWASAQQIAHELVLGERQDDMELGAETFRRALANRMSAPLASEP